MTSHVSAELHGKLAALVRVAASSRSCDGCDLCCTVLEVDELQKAAGQRCGHLCDSPAGQNCRIYADRPASCREFACMWRMGVAPEKLKPSKVGFVLVMRPGVEPGRPLLTLHADPARPEAWASAWALTRLRALAIHWKAALAINIPPDRRPAATISPIGKLYLRQDRPDLFVDNHIRTPAADYR